MGYIDTFKQKDSRTRISILKTNLCAVWTVLWKESAQMNTDKLRDILLVKYDRKPRLQWWAGRHGKKQMDLREKGQG